MYAESCGIYGGYWVMKRNEHQSFAAQPRKHATYIVLWRVM